MARKKALQDDELVRLLDEYRLDNPGIKIKIPKFGEYVRSKGYPVQDYTIRRSNGLKEYLKTLKQGVEQESCSDVVAYKTLDVDAFLESHRTRESLKEAILVRERYYAQTAAKAADAINAKKTAEKRAAELELRVAELEAQLASVQAQADHADIRQKNEVIARLKKLLDSYVYPDAANAILAREGLLEIVSSVIPEEQMKKHTITADTEIRFSEYDSVNELLGDFDD